MKKLTGIVFHDEFRTMDQASPRITLWQDGSIDKKAKPALLLIAEDGEQLPEVNEWISVKDRMPEPNIEVLVAFEDDTVPGCSQWTKVRPSAMGWLGPAENKNKVITHWMPLPKAPHQ